MVKDKKGNKGSYKVLNFDSSFEAERASHLCKGKFPRMIISRKGNDLHFRSEESGHKAMLHLARVM